MIIVIRRTDFGIMAFGKIFDNQNGNSHHCNNYDCVCIYNNANNGESVVYWGHTTIQFYCFLFCGRTNRTYLWRVNPPVYELTIFSVSMRSLAPYDSAFASCEFAFASFKKGNSPLRVDDPLTCTLLWYKSITFATFCEYEMRICEYASDALPVYCGHGESQNEPVSDIRS